MSFRRSAAIFLPNRPQLGHLSPQKFLNAPATASAVTTCCWTRGAGLSSTNSETLTRYEACSAEWLDVYECASRRGASIATTAPWVHRPSGRAPQSFGKHNGRLDDPWRSDVASVLHCLLRRNRLRHLVRLWFSSFVHRIISPGTFVAVIRRTVSFVVHVTPQL